MLDLTPADWAFQTFGTAALGDRRRTRRVVATAACLLRDPAASLPAQLGDPAALKATYRLLASDAISHAALCTPHWHATRQAAAQHSVVLLVHDTTEIDYTHHPHTHGLGPIGDNRGQGFILHSVLALVPHPRQILGLAHQTPFLRQSAPPQEPSARRRKRERESLIWTRSIAAIGAPPPPERLWVHTGDRYSDIFDFMTAARASGTHFLVRAAQDRRIIVQDDDPASARQTRLFTHARALAHQATQVMDLPAGHGHPARTITVGLAVSSGQVLCPCNRPAEAALPVWIVRIWQLDPPADGQEAIEWILLTSVPTDDTAAGWERRDWYTARWTIEDYHQCLKTGCAAEARQLQNGAGLQRLVGLLAPIAVRLLQLREVARGSPDQPASAVLPSPVVRVIAHLSHRDPQQLTAGQCWRLIAQRGGHLGRKRDGSAGWLTIWRGWHTIQLLVEGIQLAAELPP